MSRDNALDWTRAIALIGIVAAHTLTNNSSLPYNLGNGIAPIMFGAVMGMTLAVHPMTGKQVAVTSGFLFVVGAILELTPTFVLPILVTFAVIYPLCWLIVTYLPWFVGLPIALVGAVLPPVIWNVIPYRTPSYTPFGNSDGFLSSLFTHGTYPVVSWWFIPVLGYYLMVALKKWDRTRYVVGAVAVIGLAYFVVYHYTMGPSATSLGDVSHTLRPLAGTNFFEWYTLPYGHTGSLVSYLIGISSCGLIWGVLDAFGAPETLLGRNTMTAYVMNILMATSPDMFGDARVTVMEMIVIVGFLHLWKHSTGLSRGPMEYVSGRLHRLAA